MEFFDVLDQVVALLQRRSRVTYNALKLQFHLDDDQLAVLKDELLYAHPQVVEDAGRGLRWTSDTAAPQTSTPPAPPHAPPPVSSADDPRPVTSPATHIKPPPVCRSVSDMPGAMGLVWLSSDMPSRVWKGRASIR